MSRNTIPSSGRVQAEAEPPKRDVVLLLRWWLGAVLITGLGWGVLILIYFLSQGLRETAHILLSAAYLPVSIFIFWLLEKDFWLSRFMGLEVTERSSRFLRAAVYSLGGAVTIAYLLLRSTSEEEATASESRSRAKSAASEPKDNVREVVETIVFVVVLVLILKTFAAEAFVIPTGSMAETLWGYQKKVTCPKCQFEFPVNVSREVDPQEGPPAKITGCTCPQCHYHIDFTSDDTSWSSGDRVLVGKFLWDMGLTKPHRFDVTVFKYPKAPQQKQTPMNYIKRAAGLGTETIGIYFGKLYVLPGLKYDESLVDPLNLWQPQHMHPDDFSALLKHERAFQKLFDAFLECEPDGDFKQAAAERVEIRQLLGQLARYRDQDRALAVTLEGGDERQPMTDVDPAAIAGALLDHRQEIVQALEKHPEVETILGKLRDAREAMDTALGSLRDKLRKRDANADGGLLQNEADGKRLLGVLFDHRAELKTLREQGKLRFEILRRAPDILLAMRRIVYDDDFPASDLASEPQRWQGDPTWVRSVKDRRPFYTHAEGRGWNWLRYQHLLRQAGDSSVVDKEPQLITDFSGYNSYEENHMPKSQPSNWVGDLMLECEVNVVQPGGELVLQLSKGVDRFEAHWDLTNGTCALRRLTNDASTDRKAAPKAQKTLAEKPSPLAKPGTYQLRFANIDERLVVWVDGKLLFGEGVPYDAPERRGPYANDLEPASVGVQNAAVELRHLKLWRDTYYTAQLFADGGARRDSDAGVMIDKKVLSDPESWGPLRNLPARTMFVQPGHYLCLGDNSPESSDSRYWGTVPERLLLGRALLIYYPFTRAGRIR